MTDVYTLWGTSGSLYTAKVRAYLRKHRIPFVERAAGEPIFREEVVPKTGRWIMPVLVAPDGAVLQDGTDIIDALEARGLGRFPTLPETPAARAAAHVFELFGGEGLLRPAMHYRWNFDADNLAFIKNDFCAGLAPGASLEDAEAVFAFASERMRKAARSFGVTEDSALHVETSYHEFLALLDTHLADRPYLVGGLPSVGDYALFGPLFAHLGRDPHPAALMKRVAPRVYRWTERMNAPEDSTPEHPASEGMFADDIPETLRALLRFVAEDHLPELRAHIAFANAWLAERPELVAGTNGLPKPGARAIGAAAFTWREVEIETAVMPYRFWLLQRLQDFADGSAPDCASAVESLLADTGLSEMLTLRTARRVERRDCLEVWGPPR